MAQDIIQYFSSLRRLFQKQLQKNPTHLIKMQSLEKLQ